MRRKLRRGLCGYCGRRPIAKGRSHIRCHECLLRNGLAKQKYQLKMMPSVVW